METKNQFCNIPKIRFNRTDTEWKPALKPLGFFARDSIGPIRNGNLNHADLYLFHARFNRTDTEWKLKIFI